MYLGSSPGFEPNTVWFNPAPQCDAIRFDPQNKWWRMQVELIDRMMVAAEGQYYVGCPDLVENWDVLGSLRDAQTLLLDMIGRSDWVKERIAEINQAFFAVYDRLYAQIRPQDGQSMFGWFRTWAPGKVAKVQWDAVVRQPYGGRLRSTALPPATSSSSRWRKAPRNSSISTRPSAGAAAQRRNGSRLITRRFGNAPTRPAARKTPTGPAITSRNSSPRSTPTSRVNSTGPF